MEFVDNMAQNIDQIENLQLRLESEICGLSVISKFAQYVEVNVEGLRKIQISKKVREKIESKLEVSEDKKALLEGYFDQVTPNHHHLRLRTMKLLRVVRPIMKHR